MPSATIIGLDTPAGAYLARLLRARGYGVAGTARDAGHAAAMLATLGADGVAVTDRPAAADEVYRLDDSAPVAGLRAGRLLVALQAGADVAAVAAARAAGRYAVAATVHAHASRLDDPATPPLSIIADLRAGRPPVLSPTPRDLGWTPEYVDAMWRLLQPAAPADGVIASGRWLDDGTVARVAAGFFGVAAPPAPPVIAVSGAPVVATVPGWRAFTVGDDLVTALCEGLA